MAKDTTTAATTAGTSSTDLYVEPGETVRVAPDSHRFSSLYKRVYPGGIDEVKVILGLSESAANALLTQKSCQCSSVPSTLVSPEDLSSDDKATSRRAKEVAIQAARQYVTGGNSAALAQWKPLMDRYIAVGKVAINYIVLHDIEIGEGATLLISASTNALYANNIKIHGSGRISCQGDITIKCVTLQGVTRFIPSAALVQAQAKAV